VASTACDDAELANELAEHVQAFKVGINKPRSRGDKVEPFGGRGASWTGAFVGGTIAVQAVSRARPASGCTGAFPGDGRTPDTA
jgi:hypothetical protein